MSDGYACIRVVMCILCNEVCNSSFADLESGQSPGTTDTGCGEDDHGADDRGDDAEVGIVEDALVVDGDDGVTPAIGVFTDKGC